MSVEVLGIYNTAFNLQSRQAALTPRRFHSVFIVKHYGFIVEKRKQCG